MDKLPYYFIWSDKYKILADVLKSGIEQYSDFLEDKSEYYPQWIFDQTMNKADGHFLNGCFLKLRKTYDLLMSLPENSYFIFSDADILIFKNDNFENLIKHYIDISADIVFMKEAPDLDISNIGFSLIKVCEENKKLFREVLLEADKTPSALDQSLVNNALKNYKGAHYYFPSEKVGTSSTIIYFQNNQPNDFHKFISNLIVFQALCNPTQGTDSAIIQKLHQYKLFGINIV